MNIVLLTENPFKEKEIKESLKGYGFHIFQCSEVNLKEKNGFLSVLKDLNLKNAYFLREVTLLVDKQGDKVKEPEHLQYAKHNSKLNVWYVDDFCFSKNTHKASIEGFIDLDRKQVNNKDIYNWDDIFVSLKSMSSYYEMRGTYANKFSARQIVLSKFLEDISNFSNKVDLNFNPFNQNNVVEFNSKIYEFIENNKYISLHKKSDILTPLMNFVLKNGIFTRSSLNKKQRNYWYPYLNAGLPLVPKKDEVHEVTFMFHDLMHHLIPDLILDGNFDSNNKETYIIYRMLSEAFTIVLADMVFIDVLVKNNIKYDWNKRKIYPVYRDMNIEILDVSTLKEILWANVKFALLGDYNHLNSLSSKESLEPYYEKYEKFFVEDYRWTLNNFENMSKNKVNISNWYNTNSSLIKDDIKINYFSNKTKKCKTYSHKVEVIFNELFSKIENIISSNSVEVNLNESIGNSFKNYMIGQSIIFFNFSDALYSVQFLNYINEFISKNNVISDKEIVKIRNFFNLYLSKLKDDNKISKNDELLYREIVPFFEAFYVFYDKDLSFKNIKSFIDANF